MIQIFFSGANLRNGGHVRIGILIRSIVVRKFEKMSWQLPSKPAVPRSSGPCFKSQQLCRSRPCCTGELSGLLSWVLTHSSGRRTMRMAKNAALSAAEQSFSLNHFWQIGFLWQVMHPQQMPLLPFELVCAFTGMPRDERGYSSAISLVRLYRAAPANFLYLERMLLLQGKPGNMLKVDLYPNMTILAVS